MALTPQDEKLRLQQLRDLRRKWLKDQELSPREPVLPPQKQGPVGRFWDNFLREKSLWRTYTFKTYKVCKIATGQLALIWALHYFIKYHWMNVPYGIVSNKPALFPGDIIAETGEVVPPLKEPTGSHNHHHH